MAFTETVVDNRANSWREAEADRAPAPRTTRDTPAWSEAETIGAEAETWLSTLDGADDPAAGRADIDLAGPQPAALFRRQSKNTWREPLDGVGRRNLG